MTLRAEARAAYEAKVDARTSDAREALAGVLTPSDVSGLDVVHVEEGRGFLLVVFTDSDVHLAARQQGGDGWSVSLVEQAEPSGWTLLAEVTSLAHLGELLPIHDPADPEPAVAAWASQVAYKVGDRATYDGSTWECTQGHTSVAGWEPPNVPALWNRVTD